MSVVNPAAGKSEPTAAKPEAWTVDVPAYEFPQNEFSYQAPQTQPATIPQPQALSTPQQKRAPPTSPKPKFKANANVPRSSLPAQGSSSCPVLPSWAPPPAEPCLKHNWASPGSANLSATDSAKPAPMFKVARVETKSPAATWQPTVIHNMDYHDSRNKFNNDGNYNSHMNRS